MTTPSPVAAPPYRLFRTRVLRNERLSPSFTRVTVTAPELTDFAVNGDDCRIKLVLPVPGRGFADLPDPLPGEEDSATWRRVLASPCPVRTYTVRAVRQDVGEVDVEMVLHGETGPASRFAVHARPGDELALLGPSAAYAGSHGDVEFRPSSEAELLLAADETALPAVASILERLAPGVRGHAVVEVPDPADRRNLTAPAGISVEWLPRGPAAPGTLLGPVVADALHRVRSVLAPRATGAEPEVREDDEVLWDVPDGGTSTDTSGYAWLAGEATMLRPLRRVLSTEVGAPRSARAVMGYWKLGVSGG